MGNEKRLIDANALYQRLNEKANDYALLDECTEQVIRDDMEIVQEQPTVDAMEVVRCKECKYYCQDKINGVICRHPELDFDTECYDHWINTNPDDFCSYGERKEGTGNGLVYRKISAETIPNSGRPL